MNLLLELVLVQKVPLLRDFRFFCTFSYPLILKFTHEKEFIPSFCNSFVFGFYTGLSIDGTSITITIPYETEIPFDY